MSKIIKIVVPLSALAIGSYCFWESYKSYGSYREWMTLGDPSGAEFYMLNVQLFTPPAFIFCGLAFFLAGRWCFRK
jgi:hypothetical protein